MSEHFPKPSTSHESEAGLTYEIQHSTEKIQEYLELANEIYGLDYIDYSLEHDDIPNRWNPEYIAAHNDRMALFTAEDTEQQILGGGLVTMLSAEEKEELQLDTSAFKDATIASLEYQAVREENRQQGIGKELTERRVAWAQRKGAQVILTEIESTNPISAHAKAKDGFIFIDLKEDELSSVPFLVAVKPAIEGEPYGPPLSPDFEYVQKTLSLGTDTYAEVRALFEDGWIGVGAEVPENGESVQLRLQRAEKLSQP